MRFAAPWVLGWLALGPLVLCANWLASRARRRALARFAEARASLPRFTSEVSRDRRRLAFLLTALAWTAFVIAAARPQWGTRLEQLAGHGVDVAIVLDTSRSMAAEDLAPSRLRYALEASRSLLTRLAGHRVALVVFAGQAAILCPRTLDLGAARLFLDSVDIQAVPAPGTAVAEALRMAVRSLGEERERAGGREAAIVLFSDGEDHAGGLEGAISELRRLGVRVFAVGCGTPEGGPIPEGTGTYHKDREGRVVTTRLVEAPLQELAEATEGRYYRAGPAAREVEAIAEAIGALEGGELGTMMRVHYEERFQIPLAIGVAALAAASLLGDRRRERRT